MPRMNTEPRNAIAEIGKEVAEAVRTGQYVVAIFSVRGQGLVRYTKWQGFPVNAVQPALASFARNAEENYKQSLGIKKIIKGGFLPEDPDVLTKHNDGPIVNIVKS